MSGPTIEDRANAAYARASLVFGDLRLAYQDMLEVSQELDEIAGLLFDEAEQAEATAREALGDSIGTADMASKILALLESIDA